MDRLDRYDLRILQELQQDARLSNRNWLNVSVYQHHHAHAE